MLEAFTKDEEVVIEALCELSKMLPIGVQTADKEDRKALNNHQIYMANCSEGEFFCIFFFFFPAFGIYAMYLINRSESG